MNKKNITIIIALAAVCGGVMAQPKQNGRVPVREKRGYNQRVVIDTASVRVLYALNAKDIKDDGGGQARKEVQQRVPCRVRPKSDSMEERKGL